MSLRYNTSRSLPLALVILVLPITVDCNTTGLGAAIFGPKRPTQQPARASYTATFSSTADENAATRATARRSSTRRYYTPAPARRYGSVDRVRDAWSSSDGFHETFYRVGGTVAIEAGNTVTHYGGRAVRRLNYEMNEFMRAPAEVKLEKAAHAGKTVLDIHSGKNMIRKGGRWAADKGRRLWRRIRGDPRD